MIEPKMYNQESKKKSESGITGKHYERKILALIALKCLLKKEIKDFWIITNPEEVDKFDDLILSIEYDNKETELFMIQINHKGNTDRPIVADMFHQMRQKKLYLKTYEKAYKDIIAAGKYSKNDNCQCYTRQYFIFLNNCTVDIDNKHQDLKFIPVDQGEIKDFISTNTEYIAYKFEDHTNEYDETFLSKFYFYPKQINENQIDNEISNILGLEYHNIISFVYQWADQNSVTKLTKPKLLSKLLHMWFDHFQPPRNLELCNNNSNCLEILKQFDLTIISKQSSKDYVWNEIQIQMQTFSISDTNIPEDSLEFDRFSEELYIDMVMNCDVPFYIETNNRFFDSYKSLINTLKICTIVFNSENNTLTFFDMKVFNTMCDIEEQVSQNILKKFEIFFQGTRSLDILPLCRSDLQLAEAITVDTFLNILKQPSKINDKFKCSEIYIPRSIKVPLISSSFLTDYSFSECFFIICDLEKEIESIETTSLYNYFKSQNIGIHGLLQLLENINGRKSYYDSEYEPLKECNILHTSCKYNDVLLRMIRYSPIGQNIFFILKYIPKNKDFIIFYTNGSTDTVKPYISGEYSINDINLIDFFGNSEINLIRNNAGMGKTMLLEFLYQRFNPDVLVTYVNLEHIEKDESSKITNWETLFEFFCQNHKTNIDQKILRVLYNNRLKNKKLIWLVDDNGEFSDPIILDSLKQACKHGVRIWFVTRPSATVDFEMIFHSFAMELEHFNVGDQINFLKQFFQMKKINEQKLQEKINVFKNLRKKLEDNFIGNCQQTMMLAEIINDDERNELKNLSLPDIYEKFIDLKVREYSQNKKDLMLITISKLALFQFFSKDALSKVFDWEEFNIELQHFKKEMPKDEFVITFTDRDIPVFSHRTYAEFLAAQWMAHKARKQINKQTCIDVTNLVKLSFYPGLKNIRLFFDSLITKDISLIPAIISRNFFEIKGIVASHRHYHDILGRNIFHILLSYGESYDISLENSKFKRGLQDFGEQAETRRYENKIVLSFPSIHEPAEHIFNLIDIVDGEFLNQQDKFFKLNVLEYTLHAGALVELDQLLSNTQLPKLPRKTKFCLVYHAIKNHFSNLLGAVDLQGAEYKKVRLLPDTSLLHFAIGVNNITAVEKLLRSCPINLWGADDEGNTALHLVCNSRNKNIKHYVLNHIRTANIPSVFLNMTNKRGVTALHYAARKLSKWEFDQLIQCGAEVNSKDCHNLTPVMYAVIAGRKDIVDLFVSKQPTSLDCIDDSKWTVLHHAVKRKEINIIKILLESRRVEVNGKTDRGMTPLMLACFYNSKQAVQLLLHHDANVKYLSPSGKTAFDIAFQRKNKGCADLLLKYL